MLAVAEDIAGRFGKISVRPAVVMVGKIKRGFADLKRSGITMAQYRECQCQQGGPAKSGALHTIRSRIQISPLFLYTYIDSDVHPADNYEATGLTAQHLGNSVRLGLGIRVAEWDVFRFPLRAWLTTHDRCGRRVGRTPDHLHVNVCTKYFTAVKYL